MGHGTHVAGIIGGNGQRPLARIYYRTFKGIAPSASLVNVRVLDSKAREWSATSLRVSTGLFRTRPRIKFACSTFRSDTRVRKYKTDPLNQAVEAAWKAGIVVVCSAGNRAASATTKGLQGKRRVRRPLRHDPVSRQRSDGYHRRRNEKHGREARRAIR